MSHEIKRKWWDGKGLKALDPTTITGLNKITTSNTFVLPLNMLIFDSFPFLL